MVQAATLVSDTFSEVFSQLNANVNQITNSGGDTISLRKQNNNYWTGSYPDTELITDKEAYPIAVLNTPEFDQSPIGFRLNESVLEVDITVYDTRAEHPPKFVEKAVDVLKDNSDIRDAGLYSLEVVDSSKDVLTERRGDLKIHQYTVTVSFNYQDCV